MKIGPFTILGLSLILGFFLGMSAWTDRTLEFWLSMIKHTTVHVPFWMSTLVTLVFNGVILAVNVLTELYRLIQ